MIREYRVVNATHDAFHQMVQELLADGWQPQGGVAIVREYLTQPTTYYFQAFVR